ncbi:CYTH and CHAD domain-containing protein [Microlunatus panaciterrae]|uniref:CHAD domain-containing protein n=1 Tax=Microlunatus panaciterrae TaxID=400768 RepID=A0ABS2RLM4_9ACTN|nr:CYTH and CHAD domain-containing protein [Microlunatus panaciterrae]MBM7799918.1 CHAD domain-containing protein [Microlunatus panaciterrae]
MVTAHLEREDKYEVDSTFVLPDPADLLLPAGHVETAELRLESEYFDTERGDLHRLGLTLRRRTGDADVGWQLKVPAADGRMEIRSRSRSRSVPAALAQPLAGVTRGQELRSVATITTTRTVTRLLDGSGQLLAEIADDRVQSVRAGEAATLDTWREVEVELGPAGDQELLSILGQRLTDVGARPSPDTSKLRRALGSAASSADRQEEGTLGQLIDDYLQQQYTAIALGDLGLRLSQPMVHATRVALRRLRSTLRTFGSVFDAERVAELDAEVVWFANLLGEVRDRDILIARLAAKVAELPPEYVLGPVAATIESTLSVERSDHLEAVATGMASERYRQLLDLLDAWRTAPPLTAEATQPAAEAADHLKKAKRKLDRRLRSAGGDVAALHRARKAGKRFRYAAELAAPVLGKKASKSVRHGKKLQKRLGEHQDSVVSAAFLLKLGTTMGTRAGHNGLTYGILLAGEWHTAERIRAKLRIDTR